MCDLTQPHFQDADKAREYLENLRWPEGPVCPHCDTDKPPMKLQGKSTRPGLYKCVGCRKQFTVTVGTVFERSRVPLKKWLMAVHLMCASMKGISAHQLHRMLGVTYKTAWFMAHRIREAMRDESGGMFGGGGGTVEADETYWGNPKRRGAPKKGRGYHHKEKIVSLVERGGRARSFHVQEVNAKTLRPILREQIDKNAHLITDEASVYTLSAPPIEGDFLEYSFVKHGIGEYVRGDVHTNTIENYFLILKRGLTGTFHHVRKQHLKRYLCEFDSRYNYRAGNKITDRQLADICLKGISGKRLTYRRPAEA